MAGSDMPDTFHKLHMIAKRARDGYFVCTATVDGFFERSGFRPDCIFECAGSLGRLQCTDGTCPQSAWDGRQQYREIELDRFSKLATGKLPTCPTCGELARPNVRMYDDAHWEQSLAHAQEESMDDWLRALDPDCNLVVLEAGIGDYDRFVSGRGRGVLKLFRNAIAVRLQSSASESGDERVICLDLPVEKCICDMFLDLNWT